VVDSELRWEEYKRIDISVDEKTTGGHTYLLDFARTRGKIALCFRYTQSHFNAVQALTQGKSNELHHIQDSVVTQMVNAGKLIVDASHCEPGYGYLGCDVWDGTTHQYIGHVGAKCNLPAGQGTSHYGTGPCKAHGLMDPVYHASGKMTTGRTSKVVRRSLQDKIDQYMDRTFDVARELATQRMVVAELMSIAENMDDQEYKLYGRSVLSDILDATSQVANTVQKASSISAKSALTSAHVLYIQVTVADILNKWISDPKDREMALQDLSNRLGSQGMTMDTRTPKMIDGMPSGIGELDRIG